MHAKRVLVIGAGINGLSTAHNLLADGHDVVVVEKTDRIGGVWATCYRHAKLQIYYDMFSYSDFPFPEGDTQFPTADMVMRYVQDYADHFGLLQYVRFETEVRGLRRRRGRQGWTVGFRRCSSSPAFHESGTDSAAAGAAAGPKDGGGADGGANKLAFSWVGLAWADVPADAVESQSWEEHFDAVAVCSGLDHVPRERPLGGEEAFRGHIVHSAQYRDDAIFADQRVLLCGLGPSCVDIATDASRVARSTTVAYRNCPKFFPRMVEGVAPMPDLNVEAYVSHRLYERLDDVFGVLGLGDWFMRGENWLWKLYYGGDMHEYNIAPFDDTKNYKNAFVHDWAFVDAIKRRAVQLKRAHVARFDASETGAASRDADADPDAHADADADAGKYVVFDDGERAAFDVVVRTSGFSPGLNFLDEEQLNSIMTSEGPALYKNVFHPDLPDLAFIGFVFCESTLVEGEMQGRWLAATLAGRATLPCCAASLASSHGSDWAE